MYGIAWLDSRIEHGGGIFGDQIGLGKVTHGMTNVNIQTCQLVTWLAIRKEKGDNVGNGKVMAIVIG